MPRLDLERTLSVAALALLLLTGVFAVCLSIQMRSDAMRENSERREVLSRLESRLQKISNHPNAVASPAAFVDATTEGLASAQLQSYLTQAAGSQHASLVSSGGEAAKHDDPPDTIRLQATLEMNLKALRALLYQLESSTPYVFVDALTVQPIGATAGRAVEDPLLRTTLSLRGFWRKGPP
jgi:general secretion pathway protein M